MRINLVTVVNICGKPNGVFTKKNESIRPVKCCDLWGKLWKNLALILEIDLYDVLLQCSNYFRRQFFSVFENYRFDLKKFIKT